MTIDNLLLLRREGHSDGEYFCRITFLHECESSIFDLICKLSSFMEIVVNRHIRGKTDHRLLSAPSG